MKFKVGDLVRFKSMSSSWGDTEQAFKLGLFHMGKSYKIKELYELDNKITGIKLITEPNVNYNSWTVGNNCLQLLNRIDKPSWL